MGMYDSVVAACEKCGGKVEWQSKAGPCELETYHFTEVPAEIAADIAGDWASCKECGHRYRIVGSTDPYVCMTVTTLPWFPSTEAGE